MSELPVAIADNDLNFQQEQFVLEFAALNFKEAGLAAQRAGYAHPHVQGPRLLKNVRVAAAIRELRDEFYRERHLTRDRILYELAIAAGFDLGEFLTNGVLDLSKIKGEATRAIAGIEQTTVGRYTTKTKVKMVDKLAALRLLMQHLGMINEGQVNVTIDFGELLDARRARAVELQAKKVGGPSDV